MLRGLRAPLIVFMLKLMSQGSPRLSHSLSYSVYKKPFQIQISYNVL
jgi:hypothetical protein